MFTTRYNVNFYFILTSNNTNRVCVQDNIANKCVLFTDSRHKARNDYQIFNKSCGMNSRNFFYDWQYDGKNENTQVFFKEFYSLD